MTVPSKVKVHRIVTKSARKGMHDVKQVCLRVTVSKYFAQFFRGVDLRFSV